MKKTKIEGKPNSDVSRIFYPFRTLGHVTIDIPAILQSRGSEHFVISAVEKGFHIYKLSNLRLVFASAPLDGHVDALASSSEYTFVGINNQIQLFERAKLVATLDTPSHVCQLLSVGFNVISSHVDNVVRVWDISNLELYCEIKLPQSQQVSYLAHPSTYLNKILIGCTSGTLLLWNIRKNKLIYEFPSFGTQITFIEQAPVVDVVAIGLLDGSIILHNIKVDKTVMKLRQEERVTSISFRTDEYPHMYTGSPNGSVLIWNLDEPRVIHTFQAHHGCIGTVRFVHGSSSILTSGSDNSIKHWAFNNLDGNPNLLRQRNGHSQPPSFARFYDDEGKVFLTAGKDRTVRTFNLHRDEMNAELSQGSIESRSRSAGVDPFDIRHSCVTHLSSCTTRSQDWDDIVTSHLNESFASTWSYGNKRIGAHRLKSTDGSSVKCTAVSPCGNFALLGCSSGKIDVYNMQSGIYKCSYTHHDASVSAVELNSVNTRLISASLDGHVNIRNFKTGHIVFDLDLGSPISKMILNRTNNLVAVVTDDLYILVIDSETGKIVRKFQNINDRVSDLLFSPDGRWIVIACIDCTIRTYDIPAGSMVDAFTVSSCPTSIDMSSNGEYMVSTHVNSVGVSLWLNRQRLTGLSLTALPEDFDVNGMQPMPTPNSAIVSFDSPVQLDTNFVTLSSEPRSKWHNILNLETIKKRNKPKEAPKLPEKAPFFLPTLPGLESQFSFDKADHQNSNILSFDSISTDTAFISLLASTSESLVGGETFAPFLKTLTPSQFDFELRNLASHPDHLRLMQMFLKCLLEMMTNCVDYELAHAYVARFLDLHMELILENSDWFQSVFAHLSAENNSKWRDLDEKLQGSLCILDFVRTRAV